MPSGAFQCCTVSSRLLVEIDRPNLVIQGLRRIDWIHLVSGRIDLDVSGTGL